MNASKKKILIAVIAVILVAALGVGAYFLFFRGDKAPADGDKSPDATDGVQDAELTDLQQLLRLQEKTAVSTSSLTLEADGATLKTAWGADLFASDVVLDLPSEGRLLMLHNATLILVDTTQNAPLFGVDLKLLTENIANGDLIQMMDFIKSGMGDMAEDPEEQAMFNGLLDFADALAGYFTKSADKLPTIVKDGKLDLEGFSAAIEADTSAEDKDLLKNAFSDLMATMTDVMRTEDGEAIELPDLSGLFSSGDELKKLTAAAEKAVEGMDESAFKLDVTDAGGVKTYTATANTAAFMTALADALKQDASLDPNVSKMFDSLSNLFEQVKNEQTTLPAELPEGVPSELPETVTITCTEENGYLSSLKLGADGNAVTLKIRDVNSTTPDVSAFDGYYAALQEKSAVSGDLMEILMVAMSAVGEDF